MSKFSCGVTLFNPTLDEIKKVNSYITLFDEVLVYDNSADNSKYLKKINTSKLHYFYNSNNEGLAKAFNVFLSTSIELKCDALCVLDQDSVIKNDMIQIIKNDFDKFVKCENKFIGILAPKIIYSHKSTESNIKRYEEKRWVITSGSFINLKLIRDKKILFDEKFFIDRVDRDFCNNIIRNGLHIYVDNKAILYQQLGELINGRSNHTPWRHYQIARSRIYYNNKYFKCVGIVFTILQSVRHICIVLLYEKNSIDKIRAILIAFCDAIKGDWKC